MKITKYGHSAVHIKHKNVGFMIDPGSFSDLPQKYPHIDALILTHEHGDHFVLGEVQKIVTQYPAVIIITNASIVETLAQHKIDAQAVGDGEETNVKDIRVRGVGSEHAEIFCDYGCVTNTGYMIAAAFFYPGDSFVQPPEDINVLAIPIAAPWMALKEAIRYANDTNAKYCIPMHDAVLSDVGREVHFRVFGDNLEAQTAFHPLSAGESIEL